MRFPGKLAAVAVPVVIAAGALAFTATPAHALQECNQTLLDAAASAEAQGDAWVTAQEIYLDDGEYDSASWAYSEAGKSFAQADQLRARACAA
jgi:hypothetical protein